METSPHGDTRTSSCLYGGTPLWRHGDTTTRRYAFTETPSQTHAHLENLMAMCFVDGLLTTWGERPRVEQYSNLGSQRGGLSIFPYSLWTSDFTPHVLDHALTQLSSASG